MTRLLLCLYLLRMFQCCLRSAATCIGLWVCKHMQWLPGNLGRRLPMLCTFRCGSAVQPFCLGFWVCKHLSLAPQAFDLTRRPSTPFPAANHVPCTYHCTHLGPVQPPFQLLHVSPPSLKSPVQYRTGHFHGPVVVHDVLLVPHRTVHHQRRCARASPAQVSAEGHPATGGHLCQSRKALCC